MTVFLCLCIAAALAVWVRERMRGLEERTAYQERRIAALTERIFVLEGQRNAGAHTPPPPPAPVPAPIPAIPIPAMPMSVPQLEPEPPPRPMPPMVEQVMGPAPEPKRDLEAMIGGNWLSKLGVLLLLIGIALFIGFSLTEMGPVGRILTGLATSVALLAGGVVAERKDDYRVLGRALIGGGWAGLYFTAFAAHGVDASRVIESAGVGFFLLLSVAAGMILHSLRYRSQTITGLAYMAAFLTIAISSLTQFSAIASIPLLISMLTVAWKFGWQPLAAAGAFFAYLAYGFDLATGDKDRYFIQIGEPVLWTYWVILEAFDLAAKRRGAVLPIAPLNLTGFLFATAAVWPSGSGWQPGWMLGAMAVAQLVSGMLRGRLSESHELADDSVFGGFRASITYSSLFTAAFVIDRFTGTQRGFALILLAESVAVFGWLFRSAYLRGLGAALFALPVIFSDHKFNRPGLWTLFTLFLANRLFLQGTIWYTGGAVFTLAALLLTFDPSYLQPVLLTIGAGGVGLALRWRDKPEGRWAGVALAFLSVVALVMKVPAELIWVTIGLPIALYAAFGWAIPEGLPRLATFVLMQFYAGALLYRLIGETPWLMAAWMGWSALCWIAGMMRIGPSLAGSALLLEGVALVFWCFDILGRQDGLAAQVIAVAALFAMYLTRVRDEDPFARAAAWLHGVAAALVTTAMVQDFVSGRRLTLAWGAEAFVFLGAGIGLQRRQLRLTGLLLFALCLGKLFFFDFSQLDTLSRILSFIVLGTLLIAASWAYSRFREQIKRYF
ncbi:MAG: DUF2339 domain-containing protein [Acidobacteria bacterium]|nr:DUF2339 domain-containing protein [Acidobacteriota bacterium]